MSSTPTLDVPRVEIRPAGERDKTRIGWLDSKHSFSFGNHHDPATPYSGAVAYRKELKTSRLITLTNGYGHGALGVSTCVDKLRTQYLVNRLVPDAHRETGDVSAMGKGRHTSTQAVALRLPEGGWVIDTPGIRSLGLAHVSEPMELMFADNSGQVELGPGDLEGLARLGSLPCG